MGWWPRPQHVTEAAELGYQDGLARRLADHAPEIVIKESRAARRLTTLDERIGLLAGK